MSRCARCGLAADAGDLTISGVCPGGSMELLDCRDRELANLRSLLRSVTGKLEEAAEHLQEIDNPVCAIAARRLIDSVLEILS